MEISALPLFRGIAAGELPALLDRSSAREVRFAKGELLLHRGETPRSLGLVLEGGVHIIREDFWGNRSIVGLAGPGEIFAESYALAGKPLAVSVLAAADGRALFLDAGHLSQRLSANLLALLAEKNLMLTEKMRHMARRTTREKLLSYLSAQALRAGTAEFDIPLDRQQLAGCLAVDRSAMSAALGKRRDEGVLEFRKNHFRLLRREID